MSNERSTTAEGLGLLYKNLISSGIPEGLASDIVREAASMLLRRDESFSVLGELNV